MLKFTIEKLEEVDPALREHYVADSSGKFTLATSGDTRLAEFRDNNIKLTREVETLRPLKTQFDGIDPVAAKDAIAKVVTLEAQLATTPARVTELEAQLAAEKTARATAETAANRGVLRESLHTKAISAGVLPAALDILISKAESLFEVKNGAVTAKANTFSPSRPGELLTVDEWVTNATQEFPFLFASSGGGGAQPRHAARANDGKKVLTDPTSRQLGQYATDIAKGLVRVEYTADQKL